MREKLRFVVVDGYAKAGREELAAGGASSGGQLYARMLKALVPGCRVDVVHPADPGESLPTGAALADYDGIAWSGSSLTVHHDTPEVRAQIEFAREAYRAGVPQFGSCWAAQIVHRPQDPAHRRGEGASHVRGQEVRLRWLDQS